MSTSTKITVVHSISEDFGKYLFGFKIYLLKIFTMHKRRGKVNTDTKETNGIVLFLGPARQFSKFLQSMHLDPFMFGLHSSLKHRIKPTSAIIVELEAGARSLLLEFSGCMKNAVCPLLCKAEKRGCACLQSPPHHPYLYNIYITAFENFRHSGPQGCNVPGMLSEWLFFLGQKNQISVITLKQGQTCYSFF